jgi:hypothetical protein
VGDTYSAPEAGGAGLDGGGPDGGGLLGGELDGGLEVGPLVGVLPPPSVTVTSSKPADAYPVCRPMRPVAATELVPEPTVAPSTRPVDEAVRAERDRLDPRRDRVVGPAGVAGEMARVLTAGEPGYKSASMAAGFSTQSAT